MDISYHLQLASYKKNDNMCICMYECMYACLYVCIDYVCMYVLMFVCMCVYICMCVYMYVCLYVSVCLSVCILNYTLNMFYISSCTGMRNIVMKKPPPPPPPTHTHQITSDSLIGTDLRLTEYLCSTPVIKHAVHQNYIMKYTSNKTCSTSELHNAVHQ